MNCCLLLVALQIASCDAGLRDFVPTERTGAEIQKAIDAAAAAGGGRVVLDEGIWPSATLFLRSNVELHLKRGAVLLGSPLWSDYADVDDPRIGKVPERSKKAFLAAIGCTNVVLSGEGTVDGQGVSFYDANVPEGRMFRKPPHPRTRMAEFVSCKNVRIEGLFFKDSPGWTFWIRNCDDIVCTRLKIHGDQRMINNDGLHFDGCRRVRVTACDIRTGDDCIVMRANRMPGGSSVCEDMVVEDCRLDSNCQAIRLGCPSDDTIRNGVFRNLQITGNNGIASNHPNRYLQPGCRGYCRMEKLLVENCSVDVRGIALLFTVDPGIRLRRFGGVTFRNLKLKSNSRVILNGTADSPLVDVRFESCGDTAGPVPFVRHPSDSWEADAVPSDPGVERDSGRQETERPDCGGSIRVGTWNIRLADRGVVQRDGENYWDHRKADVVALVKRMNPDVFGLQEVTPEQMDYLRANLPEFAFVGEHRNADRMSGEASPVCYRTSRFDVLKKGTFWLSETPDSPGSKGWGAALPRVCSYLVLREKSNGRTFCFANAHTDNRSELAREKGMLLVLDRMREFGAGAPIVFTGDHNCRETEAPAVAVSKLLKNALYETQTPPVGSWRTFNGWRGREREVPATEALELPIALRNERRPVRDQTEETGDSFCEKCGGSRIDYIYVSPGVRVLDYATVNDVRPNTNLYPSDHFPLLSTIALP